jgi:hypothetical protein
MHADDAKYHVLMMACLYAVVAALNSMAPPATRRLASIRDAIVCACFNRCESSIYDIHYL